jgi:hypothetical protein
MRETRMKRQGELVRVLKFELRGGIDVGRPAYPSLYSIDSSITPFAYLIMEYYTCLYGNSFVVRVQ